MLSSFLLALAFVPMLVEARLSAVNERALRAAGAIEPASDVYPAMRIAYLAGFLAMAIEAWWSDRGPTTTAFAGLVVFAAAKALKYWAVATLGPRWTFRVLVPPGSQRTRSGPYGFLRHPNYIAVIGELAGFALVAQAPIAGAASVVLFGLILRARIRVEEQALGLRSG